MSSSPDPNRPDLMSSHTVSAASIAEALLNATPDAMIVIDMKRTILLINKAAEKLFGHSRKALVGQNLEILIPQRFRDAHKDHEKEYMAKPHARVMGVGLDLFGLRADGTEFAVEISLSPLRTDQGRIFLAAVRDVSHRRLSDELREQSVVAREAAADIKHAQSLEATVEYQRALYHYEQLVRHRLANPIHIIQGMAVTLLENKNLDEETRKTMLENIHDASKALARESLFYPDIQDEVEDKLHPKPFDSE